MKINVGNALRAGLLVLAVGIIAFGQLGLNTVAAETIAVRLADSGRASYSESGVVSSDVYATVINVGSTTSFVLPLNGSFTQSDAENFGIDISGFTGGTGKLQVRCNANAQSDAECYMWDETTGDAYANWTHEPGEAAEFVLTTTASATLGQLVLYVQTTGAWAAWTVGGGTTWVTIFTQWSDYTVARQFAFTLTIPSDAGQATGTYGTIIEFQYTPTG